VIRWGVAGTGGIAERFTNAMTLVDDGAIVAVASRRDETARRFAERFGITRAHASYEALAADPDVDVVYVATPHSRHATDTLLYLAHGKHVLCEKPFALNGTEARAMVAAARESGTFLMEAMWSRFLPSYRALADLRDSGTLGDLRFVEASFGFAAPLMPEHRLFDATLGGGSLLDVGIYPLHLCAFLLGVPDRIVATGVVGETGVDEQVIVGLHHESGALGMVSSAIRTNLRCDARIVGERGVVDVPAFMHCPDRLVVSTVSGSRTIECGWEGDGLRFQIEEVQHCIGAGRTESDVMPLRDTLALADVMDTIRRQIGVTYPGEHS
jgi:predicted dehydrogenase